MSSDPVSLEVLIGTVEKKDNITQIIRWLASILLICFSWLNLQDFPVVFFTNATASEAIIKIAIQIYFFCWVFGSAFDTKIHQDLVIASISSTRLRMMEYSLILGTAVLFAAICLTYKSNLIIYALIIFMINNIICWHHIVNRMLKDQYSKVRETLTSSKDTILHDAFLLKTKIKYNYINGTWQWVRLFSILAFVILLAVVLAVESLRAKTQLDAITIRTYGFVAFVVIAEGWMYGMRFALMAQLHFINKHLAKREDIPEI